MTVFTVRVHREEDHYWAEVVEMPGCFAAGATLAELGESLDEAVALWREDETVPGYILEELILEVAEALDDADFERPHDVEITSVGIDRWRHYAEWLVRCGYVASKLDGLAAANYRHTFDRALNAYLAQRPTHAHVDKPEETP